MPSPVAAESDLALAASETAGIPMPKAALLADALTVAAHLQDAGYPNAGDLAFSQENLEQALAELQQDLCLSAGYYLDHSTWENLQKKQLSQAATERLRQAKSAGLSLNAIPLREKSEKSEKSLACERIPSKTSKPLEPIISLPTEEVLPSTAGHPDAPPAEVSPGETFLADSRESLVAPPVVAANRAFQSANLPEFFWLQWALAELADRDAEFQWQLSFRKSENPAFTEALTALAIQQHLFTGNDPPSDLRAKVKPYLADLLKNQPFPNFFPEKATFPSRQLQELAAAHYQRPNFVAEKNRYSETETQAILQSFDSFSRLLFQEETTVLRPERLGLGIGIQVLYNDLEPPLAIPYPEGAAADAGLKQPFWLYGLDQDIARRSVLENLKLEREQKLTIHYPTASGSKSQSLRVGYYPRPSLVSWREGNTLWLRIFNFRFNETADLLVKALQGTEKGAEKTAVVFDLRYCNGGSFAEMSRALSLLVPENTPLFDRYADGARQKSQERLKVPYLPLTRATLLISRYTASSAEIFTLALRQQRAWPVWGETSFGKCTVQERRPLAKNWSADLSILEIKDRNGQGCHGQGIVPDEVFLDSLFADSKTWQRRLDEKAE